jgi:hypothetical protein
MVSSYGWEPSGGDWVGDGRQIEGVLLDSYPVNQAEWFERNQRRCRHWSDQMLTFLSLGHNSFILYLDHDNSLDANLTEDDVVNFPITHLPPVSSPRKASNNALVATTEEARVQVEHNVHVNEEEEHPIPIQVIYPDSPADDVSNYVFAKRNCSVGNDEDANMEEPETAVIQAPQHGATQPQPDAAQPQPEAEQPEQ